MGLDLELELGLDLELDLELDREFALAPSWISQGNSAPEDTGNARAGETPPHQERDPRQINQNGKGKTPELLEGIIFFFMERTIYSLGIVLPRSNIWKRSVIPSKHRQEEPGINPGCRNGDPTHEGNLGFGISLWSCWPGVSCWDFSQFPGEPLGFFGVGES